MNRAETLFLSRRLRFDIQLVFENPCTKRLILAQSVFNTHLLSPRVLAGCFSKAVFRELHSSGHLQR